MEDSIVTQSRYGLLKGLRSQETMRTNRQHDELNERRIAAGERRYAESFEAELAVSLEDLLDTVWQCERWEIEHPMTAATIRSLTARRLA